MVHNTLLVVARECALNTPCAGEFGSPGVRATLYFQVGGTTVVLKLCVIVYSGQPLGSDRD